MQASAESDQIVCIRMSRVESLVYWFESHSMLSVLCMVGCESVLDYLMKLFCTLAYPTFIVVCSALWYPLLRWSSTIGVSRCEEHPWATGRWWFRCIVRVEWSLISLWIFFIAHVIVRPWIYILLLNSLSSFLLGIVVCLGL